MHSNSSVWSSPLLIPLLLLIARGALASAKQPDIDNSRCSEPRDKGAPCPRDGTPPSKQFHYNTQMGVCQPFLFKGCEGNSNRFDSAEECRQACAASGKQDTWVLADKCNAKHLVPDGKYIECAIDSAQSCPEGHDCREEGVCCPTKEYLCALQDDTGTFAEGVPDKPRFAWSADIKSCWRFSYYGAKGNYNNFPSFQDCMAFCAGNGTAAGTGASSGSSTTTNADVVGTGKQSGTD